MTVETPSSQAGGEEGRAPLTPVMRQYREAKQQHPDGILLFRLGDFYEIFFEDAELAALEALRRYRMAPG